MPPLDGLRVTGELSAVMVEGGSNTLQNMVIDGQRSDWWSGRAGSIIDGGVGTRILFNTIVPMPTGRGSAIALRAGASATQIFGNILASTDAALRFQFDEMPVLDSNYNLMEAETPVVRGKASDVLVSRESWVDFGQDHASIFTTPVFAEGEYRLCAGALGTAMTGLSPVTLSVELDAMGDVRSSDAPDIGALLAAPECPSFPN